MIGLLLTVIDEGVVAPEFELPALVDGEHRRVSLSEHLGDAVVVLAFYPADFNPACEGTSALDRLDLFTLRGDLTVLGIGPDTLYAHEAFANEYDIGLPLLSDPEREVAAAYGVTYEDEVGQRLIARAVVVVDQDGEVAYGWHTEDPAEQVPIDALKGALGDTGGDETAFSQYRVGYAHYVEGRRAFTSAMTAHEDTDWVFAQSDFKRAQEEFEAAADCFGTAVRFVDDESTADHYEAAMEKATALRRAAGLLGRSASEHASGARPVGQEFRADAGRPLETARSIADPIDPNEWPPAEPSDSDGGENDERSAGREGADDDLTTLGSDLDASPAGDGDVSVASDGAGAAGAGGIDDEELAELEAEIAASGPDEPHDDAASERGHDGADASPAAEASEDTPDGDPRDVDAVETDLAAGVGGGSLEPGSGSDGEAAGADVAGAEEPHVPTDEAAEAAEDAADDEDDREAGASESTSLEGIPSEEELSSLDEADDVATDDEPASDEEPGDATAGADG
jgi:peroxiredoxin